MTGLALYFLAADKKMSLKNRTVQHFYRHTHKATAAAAVVTIIFGNNQAWRP